MQFQQAVYPLVLAGANVAMGWLLYYFSEPIVGGLLIVIGTFVILVSMGSTLKEHQPVLSDRY